MGFSTTRTQEEIENDKKNNSAFVKMSLTNAQPTVSKNLVPTGHWQSQYKKVSDDVAANDRIVSRRPLWSINRLGYSSMRGSYMTEFAE